MSPMQKQFYKRWNFTYFIRRPEYPKSWKYKKDILEIQALSDAIRYLLDFDIHTPEELKAQEKTVGTGSGSVRSEIKDPCVPNTAKNSLTIFL